MAQKRSSIPSPKRIRRGTRSRRGRHDVNAEFRSHLWGGEGED